jgi:hypothetical protein
MLLIRAFGCHFVSFRVHVQAFGWTLGKSGPIGLIGPFATAPRRGADAAVLPQHDCLDGGKGKELTSLKVIEPSEPSEPSSLFFEAREIPIWPNLSPYQKHHGNHQICLPSGHIDVTLTSHWCHVEMRRLRGYAARDMFHWAVPGSSTQQTSHGSTSGCRIPNSKDQTDRTHHFDSFWSSIQNFKRQLERQSSWNSKCDVLRTWQPKSLFTLSAQDSASDQTILVGTARG